MKLKHYPEYKDSGVEWIGNIPEGWETHRFKINFKFIKGRIPENLMEEPGENSLPYLSMDYLRGNESSVLFSNNDPKAVEVDDGDLLLLWDGSNAGEFIEGKKGYLSSTMVKLSLENIDSSYSNYICWAFEPLLRDLTIGMGIPHVNGDHLGNIRITHPNLEEQKRIAQFLDKKTSEIDLTIEKDTFLIELLKEKRTALINHVVTKGLDPTVKMKDSGVEWIGEIPEDWHIMKLKHLVANKITDGPHETPELLDYGVPFISADAIKKDKIDFSRMRGFISEQNHRKFCIKCKPRRDDVFLIKSGATTGNVAIVETDKDFSIWSPLALIRADKTVILPRLLYYVLLSDYFKRLIEISWSYGTQQNIGMGVIENLSIIVPDIQEQNLLLDYLDKETSNIDLIIHKIRENIDLLEEYKKSLIHHVVTGKVDVREVVV